MPPHFDHCCKPFFIIILHILLFVVFLFGKINYKCKIRNLNITVNFNDTFTVFFIWLFHVCCEDKNRINLCSVNNIPIGHKQYKKKNTTADKKITRGWENTHTKAVGTSMESSVKKIVISKWYRIHSKRLKAQHQFVTFIYSVEYFLVDGYFFFVQPKETFNPFPRTSECCCCVCVCIFDWRFGDPSL